MSSLSFAVESFVFDTPPSLDGLPPLKMAAKRYTKGVQSPEGLTLLLAHGLGTHKEHWEPMLEKMFELQAKKGPSERIREAWAFDWQTHGDSAVLNADALERRPNGVSLALWTEALVAFVNSDYVSQHRLVVIGNAFGAATWMYSTKFFPFRIPYVAIVLVEPCMLTSETYQKKIEPLQHRCDRLEKTIATRRESWSNKNEALQYLSRRFPWNSWTNRALQIYVNHGLRETVDHQGRSAYVLKCNRAHEASAYRDLDLTFAATDQIAVVSNNLPIHAVFGENVDDINRYLQDVLVDRSQGRRLASVSRIPGAGHMILQQDSNALAIAISRLFGTEEVSLQVTRL